MRICRYIQDGAAHLGFYFDTHLVPLSEGVEAYNLERQDSLHLDAGDCPLPLLACGDAADAAHTVGYWLEESPEARETLQIPVDTVTLQAPVANPPKILLLAGNYASHLAEEGEIALEKQETFPYVFMKPNTTLNHPEAEVVIPNLSPEYIDYECELTIVMGKTAKGVSAADALDYVAGYTVMNDVSNRKFTPNPERKERERDKFFDWLHGKWHDGFCPIGPAVASARSIPDPQTLDLKLTVNGELRQETNTDRMIYPVADVIQFVSSWVTLEPGDIIATGTTAGVGMALGKLLRPGDVVEATLSEIGTLRNTMVAEG